MANATLSFDDMKELAQVEVTQVESLVLGRTFLVGIGAYNVQMPVNLILNGVKYDLIRVIGTSACLGFGDYRFHPGHWHHWVNESDPISANEPVQRDIFVVFRGGLYGKA